MWGASGALEGTVKDPSGALVRGASIVAIHRGQGSRRWTVSKSDGSFAVPFLAPGEWRVEVSAAGFDAATVAAIRVDIDQTARVEITLRLAGVHDTAEVREPPASPQGEVISRRAIETLPLNGRQY